MRFLAAVLGRLVAGILIGSMLAVLGVAFSVWSTARDTEDVQADAIVVLGAAQYNGTPSPVFQWRLQHALDLYREGYAPVIVTLGAGQAGDASTEADAGRQWLVTAGGVPSSDVLAVAEGSTTLESAQALGPVFTERGWSTAIVVTDPPHILRSKTMIADQGITTYGSPTRAGPAVQTRTNQITSIVKETGALLRYGFLGE